MLYGLPKSRIVHSDSADKTIFNNRYDDTNDLPNEYIRYNVELRLSELVGTAPLVWIREISDGGRFFLSRTYFIRVNTDVIMKNRR